MHLHKLSIDMEITPYPIEGLYEDCYLMLVRAINLVPLTSGDIHGVIGPQ